MRWTLLLTRHESYKYCVFGNSCPSQITGLLFLKSIKILTKMLILTILLKSWIRLSLPLTSAKAKVKLWTAWSANECGVVLLICSPEYFVTLSFYFPISKKLKSWMLLIMMMTFSSFTSLILKIPAFVFVPCCCFMQEVGGFSKNFRRDEISLVYLKIITMR